MGGLATLGSVGALGVALAPLASCQGTAGSARRVVAYVSADDALAREVLAACETATGIAIDAVFDTEATKTTGLENRVRAERQRPRADLFWSSEAFATARLAADGLLAPFPSDLDETFAGAGWNPLESQVARDSLRARIAPSRCSIAFGARARVIVWNPERISEGPRTWAEVADPNGGGSVAIADPRFGTTRGHLAALDEAWSAARARGLAVPTLEEWIDGLRARGVRVLTGGNAATVEAVVTGECALGLTDSDDALAAMARGLPVAMSLARSLPEGDSGGGTMLVPNTVGLVAGRSDATRAAAIEVALWLVSPACEAMLCRSPSRNLPLGPGVTCDAAFAEPDALSFDLESCAANAAEIASRAHSRLIAVPVERPLVEPPA